MLQYGSTATRTGFHHQVGLAGVLAALLLAGCAGDGSLQQLQLADTTPTNTETAALGLNAAPADGMAMSAPALAGNNQQAPAARQASMPAIPIASARTSASPQPVATASQAEGEDESLALAWARLQRRINDAFTPKEPPAAERQKLGDALAQKVLASARLSKDKALQRRLQRIADRLAAAARKESDFPERWRVHVLETDRADAFTSGGGHLFITRGMVELLGTDERIATVLAHEMAHNLQAHVWAAREKKELARRANRFSREVLAEQMNMPWLGRSVAFLVRTSLNTYSRQQEHDADAAGLDLLVAAGYRPQAALETFDLLRRHFRQRSALQNFFKSHHPLYERRRWYLENRIRAHYRQQAGLPPVQRYNFGR